MKAYYVMAAAKYSVFLNYPNDMTCGIIIQNKLEDQCLVIYVAKFPCINMRYKNIFKEFIGNLKKAQQTEEHLVISVGKSMLRKKV